MIVGAWHAVPLLSFATFFSMMYISYPGEGRDLVYYLDFGFRPVKRGFRWNDKLVYEHRFRKNATDSCRKIDSGYFFKIRTRKGDPIISGWESV
jgi:hypothetical protein